MPPLTTRTTETLQHVANDVIRLLTDSNQTLGVAESLTGGLIMATLTSIPGASSVIRGGVVAYATPLKSSLLGVDTALIKKEGVIHADVAAQMAEGARRATSTTSAADVPAEIGGGGEMTGWGVSTTGVAGPDRQDGKDVGMVYIGIASPRGSKGLGPFMFPGVGEQVREATVMEAMARLREALVEFGADEAGKKGEEKKEG